MKKKVLAILMISALTIASLAGCGNTGADAPPQSSANGEASNQDVNNDESKVPTEFYFGVQAYGFNEALLEITTVDGNGETYVEETGSYGWFGTPDQTIGQMMEEWDIVSIEPKCEGFDFLGWKAYEMVTEVDENGIENMVQKEIFEGKIFSTEEMMSQELLAGDIYFYTIWDLTCGGCELQKVCNVYYIDDGRYFVCDDCYEEFAYGMGLIE